MFLIKKILTHIESNLKYFRKIFLCSFPCAEAIANGVLFQRCSFIHFHVLVQYLMLNRKILPKQIRKCATVHETRR